MNVNFSVSGMNCSHCENKIRTFLNELSGVESIDVNLDSKIVSVVFNEQTNIEAIQEAILDSGFEAQII